MATDARSFVQRARELPVMPPVAAEVIRKAEDPDSELGAIAQLIARDTSLAVRVLKIANSSFYSMPRKVETLQQAIVLLGFSTLRSVVVAASMKEVFARFGLAERLLWEHAVAAGVAAGAVARHVGGFSRDEVFVGGLVHDIGKLVMHAEAESRYQEVMRMVYGDERSSIDAEREVFGFDHAEVGRLILEKWELSPRLFTAVGAHHALELPDSAPDGSKPLAAVLQLADLICLREGLGRRKPSPDLDPMQSRGAELLGLDSSDLEPVLESFRTMHDKERQVFV